jgi:hypothetical protein
MDLTFTNRNNNLELLATSDDITLLKEKVSQHYTGSELIIWQSNITTKPYSEHIPDIPCSFNCDNGSFYTIN